MNWRGRPLTSHEVVVKTIAATRTRTGLRVHAELDTADYPIGVSVSKARMDALPIGRTRPGAPGTTPSTRPASPRTARRLETMPRHDLRRCSSWPARP
jgi:hypothetical protein